MLVIGLVKMLNFSKENGDLGGLNLIFLRPQSVTVPYDVLLGLDTSFAKFFSKVAMLSIFPFREISCES